MTYATGHLRDSDAAIRARLGLPTHRGYGAMRAAAIPLSTSNALKLWGIWDQTNAQGCEGCAHSSGVTQRLALAGTPLAEPVSNVGLYLGALLVDRPPPASDGTEAPLLDVGTMPSSVLTAMARWGSCGSSIWGQQPMGSGTMYVDPNNPNSPLIEPAPEKLKAESSFKFNGAHFIQTDGDQKLLDILTALAAGYPVSIAIPASGAEFQAYRGGVLGALSGDIDHASLLVDIVSWDGKDPKTAIVSGANSWNVTWGESITPNIAGGMYRGNAAFLAQAEDACVLDVTKA